MRVRGFGGLLTDGGFDACWILSGGGGVGVWAWGDGGDIAVCC